MRAPMRLSFSALSRVVVGASILQLVATPVSASLPVVVPTALVQDETTPPTERPDAAKSDDEEPEKKKPKRPGLATANVTGFLARRA